MGALGDMMKRLQDEEEQKALADAFDNSTASRDVQPDKWGLDLTEGAKPLSVETRPSGTTIETYAEGEAPPDPYADYTPEQMAEAQRAARRASVTKYVETKFAPATVAGGARKPLVAQSGEAVPAPAQTTQAPGDAEMDDARREAYWNNIGGQLRDSGANYADAVMGKWRPAGERMARAPGIEAESRRPVEELTARRKAVEAAVLAKREQGRKDEEFGLRKTEAGDRTKHEAAQLEEQKLRDAEAARHNKAQEGAEWMRAKRGEGDGRPSIPERRLDLRTEQWEQSKRDRVPNGYEPVDPQRLPLSSQRKDFDERKSAIETANAHIGEIKRLYAESRGKSRLNPFGENSGKIEANLASLRSQLNIANQSGQATMGKLELSKAELGGDQWSLANLANPQRLPHILDEVSENMSRNQAAAEQRMGIRQTAAGQAPAGAGARIRVSNGKETLDIDPGDLQDAAAEGYREVR